MMPRLGDPLVYDLLELAEALVRQEGRGTLKKAALRRAVSTAYYAAFHAFCFVCADELVGWSHAVEDLEPIYRSVDHGQTRQRLSGRDAQAAVAPGFIDVGTAFGTLQARRHEADYASPGGTETFRSSMTNIQAWAAESLALAHQIVVAIENLDKRQRGRLAVLLIARARKS